MPGKIVINRSLANTCPTQKFGANADALVAVFLPVVATGREAPGCSDSASRQTDNHALDQWLDQGRRHPPPDDAATWPETPFAMVDPGISCRSYEYSGSVL